MMKTSTILLLVALFIAAAVSTAQCERVEWSINKSILGAQNMNYVTAHDAESIYFVDDTLNVNKLNRSTGTLQWSVNPLNRSEAHVDLDEQLTVTLGDSALVVGNSSFFCAVGRVHGDVMWCKNFPNMLYIQVVTSPGRVIFVGSATVKTLEAHTGQLIWKYSPAYNMNSFSYSPYGALVTLTNENTGNTFGVILDAATGKVVSSHLPFQTCQSVTNPLFVACLSQAPPSYEPQLTMFNLQTRKALWSYPMPGALNDDVVSLTQVGENTLLVAPLSQNVYNWIAAFNLVGGGAPFWNVTQIPNPYVYTPNTIQEFEGTFVYPAAQMNSTSPPVAFNFLDEGSGKTIFSITAPVTGGYPQAVPIGENLVIPNIMGWTRFACSGPNRDLTVQFQTLAHFDGVGSVLAEGYNGYIVTSADGVTKYVF